MNNHIEEHKIELLFLNQSEITDAEKKEMFEHFESCSLCNENYLKLKKFYEELETELNQEPSVEDKEIAERLLPQKTSSQKNF